jgi:Alginate export
MSLVELPLPKAFHACLTTAVIPVFTMKKRSNRSLPLAIGISTLFLLFSTAVFAGVAELATTPSKAVVPEKKAEANPLCFMDGKICFDIQERFRFEGRENTFDFNSDVDSLTDDTFFLNRFRIGLAYKPVDWLKFYVQGQDAQEWDSDRPDIPGAMGAEGDDNFDLRQLYVQIGTKPVSLTLGRQVLQYGDERLIGPGEWNNITKTWDAAKIQITQPLFTVDIFAASIVNIYRDSINLSDLFNGSEMHRDQIFSGIYASSSFLNFQTSDFYVLFLDQEVPNPTAPAITSPATFTGLTGKRTDFVTVGTRLKGDPKKLHGWEYEGEFAFEGGRVADLNLNAFAAHVGFGYNFDALWKPRLWLEYNFATGDHDPTDGRIETFQNLFPSNHPKYGFMDLFSWQNLHDLEFSVKAKPCKPVGLEADFHSFWLANTNDSWYRANGVTRVRPITPGADPHVGDEIDLLVTYQPVKWLNIWAGYSHFFTGKYVADTGPSDDADFGYVQATFTF